jgi:hypothetical protein
MALTEITEAVSAFRRQVATDAPFQSEAYKLKRAEAEAYLAEQPATLDGYPLLAEIAPARGLTPAAMAKVWLDTNTDWEPVLIQTESIRDKASFAIKGATSRAEIADAIAQFQTEMAALS